MPKRPQKKSKHPDPQQPGEPVPAEHPDAKPDPGDIGLQAIVTLDKHKKTVIIGTAVAAVAICVGLVGRQIADQRRTVASEAYSLAASERSIEKLDAVIADYSRSAAAGNALLTKSEIQLSLEKPEDAKIALLTFVEDHKKHPRYVQGLFALGSLHHSSGDGAKANDFYQQALAADSDSDIAPMIVIRQGDLLLEESDKLQKEGKKDEAATKKEEARAHYEDSIRRINFRANRFIPLAEEKINLLDIGDVPVVAAPPPPEPEKVSPAPSVPGLDPGPGINPGAGINPAPGVESGFKLFDPKGAPAPKPKAGEGTPKTAVAPADPAGKPPGKGDKGKSEGDQPKAKATTPEKATPSAPKPVPAETPQTTEKPATPKPAPAEKPTAPKPAPAEKPTAPKPAPSEKPEAPKPAPAEKPTAPKPAPAENSGEASPAKPEAETPANPVPAPATAPKPE